MRLAALAQYFRSAAEQLGKNSVLPDTPKPICRISGVRLDAVDNAVPVTSFRGVNILGDGMALCPAPEPEEQACYRGAIISRVRKKEGSVLQLELASSVRRGESGFGQR